MANCLLLVDVKSSISRGQTLQKWDFKNLAVSTSLRRPNLLTSVSSKCFQNRRQFRVVASQSVAIPPTESTSEGSEIHDCIIVGGGISGLVTAQALLTEHGDTFSNIVVTEARERVGGNITTVSDEKFLWEEGPNSFQPNDAMLKCAVRLSVLSS